ncbi:MAG: amidohydrolase family protein [Gemmatimonadetes bacterium]|nr:amidohydrolase family protein [Gemmatimonadota bacterium]
MLLVGRRTKLVSALWAAMALVGCQALSAQGQPFDILIQNGRVLDGTGNPDFRADVGIRGDRIIAIGRLQGAAARRTIEARDLYVAPGFIDMHSHADRALASDDVEARSAHNLVSQGITTVVGGADGRNQAWPVAAEIAAFRKLGMGLNVVPMVGHGTVRSKIMGDDYERTATPAELEQMKALVRQGMDQGAWGLGAGLEYRPGRFSSSEELVELAKAVAPYGGFYFAHQRSEAQLPNIWQVPSMVDYWAVDGVRALEETIRVAKEAGIPAVASHVKAQGRSSFGRSAIDVRLIDLARAEGHQVYLDQYPWDSYGSGRTTLIPPWALVDAAVEASGGLDSPRLRETGVLDRYRENLRRNLAASGSGDVLKRDIEFLIDANGGADRLLILDHPDAALIGKSLAEVARMRGISEVEALIEFSLNGYEGIPEGAYIRNRAMDEPDIERYMQQEYTATSSDAGVDTDRTGEGGSGRGLHPRYYGSYPRKIARYVKDRGTISLPFAIRSCTGLPAQIIGLRERGYVREGFAADIVIFDLNRIRDRATYLEPREYSEGIEYVIVNGQFTLDRGHLTGALPGIVVVGR